MSAVADAFMGIFGFKRVDPVDKAFDSLMKDKQSTTKYAAGKLDEIQKQADSMGCRRKGSRSIK